MTVPSTIYNFSVEYKPFCLNKKNDVRHIYMYSTSELNVKEILADYKIVSIEKQEL